MTGPGRDPPDDDGDGKGEEPRVRDLLRTADGAAALQPTTRAQLEAWFGLPSFEELAESGKAPPKPREPSVFEKTQARRAAAAERVDPQTLAHAERIAVKVRRDLRVHGLPTGPWTERFLAFDEKSIPKIPAPDSWRELEINPRLKDALKICAPQASLRDLHRPDKQFWVRFQSPWDDVGSIKATDPMEPIRAIVRRDYRVGTTITPAPRDTTTSLRAVRALLNAPWPDSKRPKARQREAELLAAEAEAAAGKDETGNPVVRGPEGTS